MTEHVLRLFWQLYVLQEMFHMAAWHLECEIYADLENLTAAIAHGKNHALHITTSPMFVHFHSYMYNVKTAIKSN